MDEAYKLQVIDEGKLELSKLTLNYESWYTRALSVISQIIPERTVDFISAYKLDKRKDITYETYCISDFLLGLVVTRYGEQSFDTRAAYQAKLVKQVSIISAALVAAPSLLRDIKTVLRSEVFDSDIKVARELAKNKQLRSAGVICGVVLEEHLRSIAQRRSIKFRKRKLTISDYNDALKNSSVYDIPMWRFIQRLGDIRNLCAHSKDRGPTLDEVNDIILGSEKVLKEVF